MPTLIASPTVIQAAGNKPKRIEEYAGRVNSGHGTVSVARMVSPEGWEEPGQRPEFEEIPSCCAVCSAWSTRAARSTFGLARRW
jgi:hypothetical protein